jgi:hypothetical protein
MLKKKKFGVLYLTLLHPPPLRFHCADGCWDRTQDRCNWCIGGQTLKPLGSSVNKIYTAGNFFFLTIGLHKLRPSYRRKKEHPALQNMEFL